MENVNQDHSRNYENRYDQNRRDVDREARNRENQNSQIQDPDNFDVQARYNDKTHSHFEGDKLDNRNNPDRNSREQDSGSNRERRNPTPDENNPTPSRRTNDDREVGDNRHNL